MTTVATRAAAATGSRGPSEGAAACSLGALVAYFLRLGALGFGGPVALVGYMQRDLVERRGWISREDYLRGLALSQLAPGPLAAQLAIYLGWVRAGNLGATLVGVAFVLPSFVMVLAVSAIYVAAGGLPWMRGAFYGIGAAVIGIMARSAAKLVRMTLARDALLWSVFLVNAALTVWTEREVVRVFIASGVVVWLLRARPGRGAGAVAGAVAPAWLTAGLSGPASLPLLLKVGGFFAAAGAFVFGSGLAIVPFLRGGVVQQLHWLNDRQFLDAVAVAMITPGPVVITVAFIGYLVAGPAGAFMAAAGVFLPCYVFVIVPAPHFHRVAGHHGVAAFVSGVTAAATGAIAGAVVVLGRRAIIDVPTALIALAAFAALVRARRVPEPLMIAVAGAIGFLLRARP